MRTPRIDGVEDCYWRVNLSLDVGEIWNEFDGGEGRAGILSIV